ncbi:MAG: hypothetical protein KDD69_17825 [Bdellovibrionales bacterium]|nr:hypothetical protein [Bdellovibrionales bacterium]
MKRINLLPLLACFLFLLGCDSFHSGGGKDEGKYLQRGYEASLKRHLKDIANAQTEYFKKNARYFECETANCLKYAPNQPAANPRCHAL